jgi:hypothetical protein
MPKGWTVYVRRRRRGTTPEMWDCAIPDAQRAEKAVRHANDAERGTTITARTQLSANEVALLGLEDGQIRKRPAGQRAQPVDG